MRLGSAKTQAGLMVVRAVKALCFLILLGDEVIRTPLNEHYSLLVARAFNAVPRRFRRPLLPFADQLLTVHPLRVLSGLLGRTFSWNLSLLRVMKVFNSNSLSLYCKVLRWFSLYLGSSVWWCLSMSTKTCFYQRPLRSNF